MFNILLHSLKLCIITGIKVKYILLKQLQNRVHLILIFISLALRQYLISILPCGGRRPDLCESLFLFYLFFLLVSLYIILIKYTSILTNPLRETTVADELSGSCKVGVGRNHHWSIVWTFFRFKKMSHFDLKIMFCKDLMRYVSLHDLGGHRSRLIGLIWLFH